MAQKICIVGSGGQLGHELIAVFGADAVGLIHAECDITDKEAMRLAICDMRPAFVINTAAFHKVDACELDPEKSHAVNEAGARNVAEAARDAGATAVFISTDYVFGNAKREYAESDAPDPMNVYGASKLAGERATAGANPAHYIIRTSALFGPQRSGKGHNFVTMMIEKGRGSEPVTVVADQFTAPTYAPDFAQAIKALLGSKAPYGTYHMTNAGSASWYEFAEEIWRIKKLPAPLVSAHAADRPAGAAKRPDSTVLVSEKLPHAVRAHLRPWREALAEYLQ